VTKTHDLNLQRCNDTQRYIDGRHQLLHLIQDDSSIRGAEDGAGLQRAQLLLLFLLLRVERTVTSLAACTKTATTGVAALSMACHKMH
jgi:hypothetical protein